MSAYSRLFRLASLLTSIALRAYLMLVYWMVIQFFGGQQSISAAGGVAFLAHITGFIANVVLIRLFWRPRRIGWSRFH
jgi:membrane associated rhomboid family serine protease